jgi:antitoxin component of MazEF toxin-antitoxin module
MPAVGGTLALSLSKAILKECGLTVGDEAEFEVERLI